MNKEVSDFVKMKESKEIQFKESLAKYYIKWFFDCHDSAVYCKNKGDEVRAKEYLLAAGDYLTIIMENWEAVTKESVYAL